MLATLYRRCHVPGLCPELIRHMHVSSAALMPRFLAGCPERETWFCFQLSDDGQFARLFEHTEPLDHQTFQSQVAPQLEELYGRPAAECAITVVHGEDFSNCDVASTHSATTAPGPAFPTSTTVPALPSADTAAGPVVAASPPQELSDGSKPTAGGGSGSGDSGAAATAAIPGGGGGGGGGGGTRASPAWYCYQLRLVGRRVGQPHGPYAADDVVSPNRVVLPRQLRWRNNVRHVQDIVEFLATPPKYRLEGCLRALMQAAHEDRWRGGNPAATVHSVMAQRWGIAALEAAGLTPAVVAHRYHLHGELMRQQQEHQT